jgi:hypothetical protein
VAVHIEGHRCGLVAQHALNGLDVGSAGDGQAGSRTWDTGLQETRRLLGEVRERTDQLVAQIAGNLDLLRRITKRR